MTAATETFPTSGAESLGSGGLRLSIPSCYDPPLGLSKWSGVETTLKYDCYAHGLDLIAIIKTKVSESTGGVKGILRTIQPDASAMRHPG